jgi:hypothetical protein
MAAAVVATAFAAGPASADADAVDGAVGGIPADIPGWRGIAWGMPLAEALALFDDAREVQARKGDIGNCYFQYAVPVTFEDEEWDAWLCEDRETTGVIAISIEKGFGGRVFFDSDKSASRLFDVLLARFTESFGPAHRYWHQCFNPLGSPTVQYRWYFPTTTVTLLHRDAAARWAAIRYEPSNTRPEFGPGVCRVPPVDLREPG